MDIIIWPAEGVRDAFRAAAFNPAQANVLLASVYSSSRVDPKDFAGLLESTPRVIRYKRSAFNLEAETSRGVIVYNTLYNSLCRLNKAESEMYKTAAWNRGLRQKLTTLGFIVDSRIDEFSLYHRMRLGHNDSERSRPVFVVAPTTCCNARCAYCFEGGVTRESMSTDLAEEVAQWIADTPGARENGVEITWFGGEPLLNTEAIEAFSAKLDSCSIDFTSFMITNGTLLSSVSAEEMASRWHLTEIQVTIDGDADEYARRKAFIDGDGKCKYYSLLQSIAKIADGNSGIRTQIRFNIDRSNVDSVVSSAAQLANIFGSYERISMYPAFISGVPKPLNERERIAAAKAFFQASGTATQSAASKALREMPRFVPCHHCTPNALAIDAAGRVYTCERIVGRAERAIGDVLHPYAALRNERPIAPEHEMCLTCPYLPKCAGGCRAAFDAGDLPCFEIRYTLPAYLEMF